jgi:hypothetical protein
MDLVEKLAITLYGDIGPNEWDEVDEDSKDMCRFNVRRLLSCIEEEGPTPDMILAGLRTTDMLNVEDIDGEALAAAFKSMIRAALNPSPSSASA